MKTRLLLLIVMFAMCLPLVASAQGVDLVSGGPGNWSKSTLNSNGYVAVVADGTMADRFYAARKDGGVDCISQWNGNWYTNRVNIDPTTVNNTRYVALCADSGVGQCIYAARADGGIDKIAYTWTWQTTALAGSNGIKYATLTTNNAASKYFYGARVDGGVDAINDYNGTYYTNRLNISSGVLNTYKYVALTCDNSTGQQVFGARADGGVDKIAYTWTWQTSQVVANGKYVSLTYDSATANRLYGACSTAGIDGLTLWNGSWIREHLAWSENPYGCLSTDAVSGQKIYAARRGSGLDMVQYAGGGWCAYGVNGNAYSAISANSVNANEIYGIAPVPEPGSLLALGSGTLGFLGLAIRRRK
jgi:hypothetical protein